MTSTIGSWLPAIGRTNPSGSRLPADGRLRGTGSSRCSRGRRRTCFRPRQEDRHWASRPRSAAQDPAFSDLHKNFIASHIDETSLWYALRRLCREIDHCICMVSRGGCVSRFRPSNGPRRRPETSRTSCRSPVSDKPRQIPGPGTFWCSTTQNARRRRPFLRSLNGKAFWRGAERTPPRLAP